MATIIGESTEAPNDDAPICWSSDIFIQFGFFMIQIFAGNHVGHKVRATDQWWRPLNLEFGC